MKSHIRTEVLQILQINEQPKHEQEHDWRIDFEKEEQIEKKFGFTLKESFILTIMLRSSDEFSH